MEPLFLELEEALEIHRDQIERYGGRPGVRDLQLLTSALAMAQAGAADQYFHGDLYEMAAAYLFHISQNHPFLDGNKRVAAVAALVFLKLNGIEVTATNAALEKMVRKVAEGKAGKGEISEFFRRYSSG